MKRVKTVKDLAYAIYQELKEENIIPEIMEYVSPSTDSTEIYDIEFDFIGMLQYGSCEGIYGDIVIQGDFARQPAEARKCTLLTLKTLREDQESMQVIGRCIGDIIFLAQKYLTSHRDEYIRRGYKCQKPGSAWFIYTTNLDRAKKYKNEGNVVTDLYTQKTI